MLWQWVNPTKVCFGKDAILENSAELRVLGQKALIVTGQGGSSVQNGSLGDLVEALSRAGLEYQVFSQVEANPGLETVRAGAELAQQSNTDVIIAVGGGSPLDAAKAIAALAVNDIDDETLFAAQFSSALPLVAIPTTAGTGSEVTPYSVLTYPKIQSKRSLASPLLYPRLALVDPRYGLTMSAEITADTAVDAYSHALEGYFSLKSSPVSDLLAERALSILGKQLKSLCKEAQPSLEGRQALSYGSVLAGMVISQTGTSIPHALGYALTYFKTVTHGRANGLLLPAYLHFNLQNECRARALRVLEISGFNDEAHFAATLNQLTGRPPQCSAEERQTYLQICLQSKNIRNNLSPVGDHDAARILEKSLGQ